MTTVEILQEAKNLLIEQGWIKGNWSHPDGRHCALGAVTQVPTTADDTLRAKYVLDEALREWDNHLPPWESIPTWNDHLDRTFGDVMDLYDRAILLAKEQAANA